MWSGTYLHQLSDVTRGSRSRIYVTSFLTSFSLNFNLIEFLHLSSTAESNKLPSLRIPFLVGVDQTLSYLRLLTYASVLAWETYAK